MRNLHTNISNLGIQSICQGQIFQGLSLFVRNEAVRPLRAYLSALRWFASRLSIRMRDARWQGLADMAFTAKQPARCFAMAKQHERHVVRVTTLRSVV